MKVLIISTQYPYPADNGKKIILKSIFDFIIESSDCVDCILIGNQESSMNFDTSVTNSLKIFGKPKLSTQLLNILYSTLIRRRKSIQESILFSNKIKKRIGQQINKNNYDLILYDTLRTGQYMENRPDVEQYIYLDDLFSIRYNNMLTVLSKYKDIKMQPLGNFKNNLPKALQKLVDSRTICRFLLNLEKNLIKKNENNSPEKFDKVLLISSKEINILKERNKSNCNSNNNIFEVKPKLAVPKVLDYKVQKKDRNRFIFLGALNVPHNDVSICKFIESTIRQISEHIPNFELVVIGKNPSAKLIELSKKYNQQIKLIGYIENLDIIFDEAAAMIIPLLFGSGVKIKTLEALSRGLPVISTDFGLEGISSLSTHENEVSFFKNGFIIENDFSCYHKHISWLLDKGNNLKARKNALEFFNNNYSEAVINKEYLRIFHN